MVGKVIEKEPRGSKGFPPEQRSPSQHVLVDALKRTDRPFLSFRASCRVGNSSLCFSGQLSGSALISLTVHSFEVLFMPPALSGPMGMVLPGSVCGPLISALPCQCRPHPRLLVCPPGDDPDVHLSRASSRVLESAFQLASPNEGPLLASPI